MGNRGPKKDHEAPKRTIDFLQQPYITYCSPSRKDTIYCGKDENGKSQYKPERYLLCILHEIVSLYNEENEEKTSYYKVQDVVNTEKQFILQGDIPEDDC